MRFSVLAASVFAVVLMAASPVFAFSEEPISGTSGGGSTGGNRFLDPDAGVPRLSDPAPGTDEPEGRQRSPFSFSVTGPGMQGTPSVQHSGEDNRHLYWNNTTNRHESYGRNSTSNRDPYRR
jgi:hypothetical protein